MGSFGSRKDEMVTYLQHVVGLSKKVHAVAIADYVKQTITTCAAHTNFTPAHKQITLCVEGNISAGKTTFLSEIVEGSIPLKVLQNLLVSIL